MVDDSARARSFKSDSMPQSYQRHLAPYLFEPWAELLLDAVDPRPGDTVLDVASGTGVVARAAARRVGPAGRVLATDISPVMLDFNARYLAGGDAGPAAGDGAPMEFAVASATDLGRPDGEFDLVLCQQGMPFFPDRSGAVCEMHRVLRSGGTVGIAVWTPGHDVLPFGWINDPISAAGGAAPFPGAFDLASYVMDADQVADLLRDAGFTDVVSHEVALTTRWSSVQTLLAGVHGTPFGPVLAALDEAARDRVGRQITERFATLVHDGMVLVPTYSVIARATA